VNRRLMLVLVAYFGSLLVVLLAGESKVPGLVATAIAIAGVAWVFNDMRPKH